ncbi:MAG: TGS domain-containing protein, partial [Peptococcaceae bacterium]|nr:TGS domain-containing protein [Peptococcaceae bacterium]
MSEHNITKIKVSLPDGAVREYPKGTSLMDIARDISRRLAKEALVAKVNGQLVDLSVALEHDAEVAFLTFDDEEGKQVFRHSTAHVMAQAVEKLFPGTKLAIGPAIADGFYYDFDTEEPFSPEDLAKIEKEMEAIIKADLPFERFQLEREQALTKFGTAGQNYKVELIDDLPADVSLSCYRQGDFTDLCMGPHVPSTGRLKAIKLMSVAGAYWRGSEKNKML